MRECKAHPQADTDDITDLEWSVPQKAKQKRKTAAKGGNRRYTSILDCIILSTVAIYVYR